MSGEESLLLQLKTARRSSSGKDFAISACTLFTQSVLYTVFLLIFMAVPISAIVMGAKFKDDCPAEKYIPIYLIVFGVFALVKSILGVGSNCRRKDDNENSRTGSFIDGILSLFLFAWFIAGNVWIYGLINDWTSDESASNYCHPTLYYYAFWLITASYIFIGVTCLLMCVVMVCLTCFA